MYEIRYEQALQEVLAKTQGYLVNVWPGREITAHDLQHLSRGYRNTIKVTEAYPKYFAESAHEIDQKWGNGNWKYCPNYEQSDSRQVKRLYTDNLHYVQTPDFVCKGEFLCKAPYCFTFPATSASRRTGSLTPPCTNSAIAPFSNSDELSPVSR